MIAVLRSLSILGTRTNHQSSLQKAFDTADFMLLNEIDLFLWNKRAWKDVSKPSFQMFRDVFYEPTLPSTLWPIIEALPTTLHEDQPLMQYLRRLYQLLQLRGPREFTPGQTHQMENTMLRMLTVHGIPSAQDPLTPQKWAGLEALLHYNVVEDLHPFGAAIRF